MKIRSLLVPWNGKLHAYTVLQSNSECEDMDGVEKNLENSDSPTTHSTELRKNWRLFVNTLAVFSIAQSFYLMWMWASNSVDNKHLPQFDMEEVTIFKNTTWEAAANPETNALWETGVPGITGWVQMSSPRELGLPKGLPSLNPDTPDDEVYIVTWGHQHHCLKMLRKAFWDLVDNRGTFVGSDNLRQDLKDDRSQIRHLMHCWDYLRQTVSCQSDLTLEGISPHDNPEILDIDGYHVKHQCKNKKAVAKWLLDHAPSKEAYPVPEINLAPFEDVDL